MPIAKTKVPAGAATAGVAHRFGERLRAACETKGLDREKFIAAAQKKFRDVNDVTPGRWFDGDTLPRRAYRSWIASEFGIEVPAKRTGEVRVRPESPKRPQADYMAYAVGSLQKAIQSSDDQIVHAVSDSLKDPAQNPWMRIAVTLIRQAHSQE